jgi:hypothetical protein
MLTQSTTTSSLHVHQLHRLKTYIEPQTPRDMLSFEPIIYPTPQKKLKPMQGF